MKKLLVMLLITLQMMCFFTACTESSASAPRVLEIQTETYSEYTKWANHLYEITGTKIFTDAQVAAKKDFTFMNKTYSLNYKESESRFDSTYHCYTIPGHDDDTFSKIFFYDDGEPFLIIMDPICTVDGITENTSAEEAARLAQEKLSPYIDFNQCPTLLAKNYSGYFDLKWYRVINGFNAERISIFMRKNGEITHIALPPSKFEVSDAQYEEALKKYPPETHKALIKAKLDKIYKTDTLEYKEDDWHIQDFRLVSYEGKPAMDYGIGLQFRKKNTEPYWGEYCQLLIILE